MLIIHLYTLTIVVRQEAEKQLKRRARNPLTGKSELIDNISYKDWLKQHDIVKTTAPVDIFVYSDKI